MVKIVVFEAKKHKEGNGETDDAADKGVKDIQGVFEYMSHIYIYDIYMIIGKICMRISWKEYSGIS